MAFSVYRIRNNHPVEITQFIGNVSWGNNVDTLGVQFEYDVAYSDMPYIAKDITKVGDIIVFKDGNIEVFKGINVSEDNNGRSPKHYVAFDFAYYLNKSKVVIQFNNIAASEAIKRLMKQFNIKSSIVSIPTKINKIYKEETVSDIIKDIIEQAEKELGTKYRMEMRSSALYIVKQSELYAGVQVNAISNPSRSLSIEEMKNSIIITSSGEESSKVVAQAKDGSNISKYGLLQEVKSVEDKDIKKAQTIANNLLKELNKIGEEVSLELFGNSQVRAGKVLVINEPISGITGKYLIKDCKHSLSNGIHKMSLTLGGV